MDGAHNWVGCSRNHIGHILHGWQKWCGCLSNLVGRRLLCTRLLGLLLVVITWNNEWTLLLTIYAIWNWHDFRKMYLHFPIAWYMPDLSSFPVSNISNLGSSLMLTTVLIKMKYIYKRKMKSDKSIPMFYVLSYLVIWRLQYWFWKVNKYTITLYVVACLDYHAYMNKINRFGNTALKGFGELPLGASFTPIFLRFLEGLLI